MNGEVQTLKYKSLGSIARDSAGNLGVDRAGNICVPVEAPVISVWAEGNPGSGEQTGYTYGMVRFGDTEISSSTAHDEKADTQCFLLHGYNPSLRGLGFFANLRNIKDLYGQSEPFSVDVFAGADSFATEAHPTTRHNIHVKWGKFEISDTFFMCPGGMNYVGKVAFDLQNLTVTLDTSSVSDIGQGEACDPTIEPPIPPEPDIIEKRTVIAPYSWCFPSGSEVYTETRSISPVRPAVGDYIWSKEKTTVRANITEGDTISAAIKRAAYATVNAVTDLDYIVDQNGVRYWRDASKSVAAEFETKSVYKAGLLYLNSGISGGWSNDDFNGAWLWCENQPGSRDENYHCGQTGKVWKRGWNDNFGTCSESDKKKYMTTEDNLLGENFTWYERSVAVPDGSVGDGVPPDYNYTHYLQRSDNYENPEGFLQVTMPDGSITYYTNQLRYTGETIVVDDRRWWKYETVNLSGIPVLKTAWKYHYVWLREQTFITDRGMCVLDSTPGTSDAHYFYRSIDSNDGIWINAPVYDSDGNYQGMARYVGEYGAGSNWGKVFTPLAFDANAWTVNPCVTADVLTIYTDPENKKYFLSPDDVTDESKGTPVLAYGHDVYSITGDNYATYYNNSEAAVTAAVTDEEFE